MAIRLRLLGTAAGGGLPQWNCACGNCRAARNGEIPARTQSSVALSADGEQWFLVNASPDLRAQILATPELWPKDTSPRNSPVAGVLLTNADLDHVLGLPLLREGSLLPVWAPEAVRETVTESLHFDTLIGAFSGLRWHTAGLDPFSLITRDGAAAGLCVSTIFLPGPPPRFAGAARTTEGHSVAYQITDADGHRVLIAPDVAAITPELQRALETADAVLFDGTFWTDDELRRLHPEARTAREMNHLPIADGSLDLLSKVSARWKVFTHINNTNPILAAASPERSLVEQAGLVVGQDGMEWTL